AGIGNISALLVKRAPELLVLTDQDPYYLKRLRKRFAGLPGVSVDALTLPDDGARERFLQHRIDTVIALNVLEHIPDDRGALQSMRDMLISGGRVVVLVPAMRALYGSLDKGLGHVRRYDAGALRRLFDDADLLIDRVFFFNMVGALGWFANSRLLGVARIPKSQVQWFDRLVPCLRAEDFLPRPFGQSLIAVGVRA
ncbi:MAG: methyltransferase, partial [Acidimicrobiia bacterium]